MKQSFTWYKPCNVHGKLTSPFKGLITQKCVLSPSFYILELFLFRQNSTFSKNKKPALNLKGFCILY